MLYNIEYIMYMHQPHPLTCIQLAIIYIHTAAISEYLTLSDAIYLHHHWFPVWHHWNDMFCTVRNIHFQLPQALVICQLR